MLKDRTLFITGASRGIGLAIALRAARDGANIAIAAKTDQPHPKLPGTIFTAADEIAKAGGHALPLVVDVRDEPQVKSAIERTVATFGGIDIVVNNASRVQRTQEVMGDGAYLVFQKPSRSFPGNFLIDDTFLAAEGITNFEKYRVDASQPLAPTFFVPDDAAPPGGVSVTGERWE